MILCDHVRCPGSFRGVLTLHVFVVSDGDLAPLLNRDFIYASHDGNGNENVLKQKVY